MFTAILADRAKQDPARPAIFMSTNKHEFKPGAKAKVPERIYETSRLLFRESFDDLSTAVGRWKAQFP